MPQIKNIPELHKFAQDFLDNLTTASNASSRKTAVVIGLRGELGAGKTAFVKEVANILGIKLHITSPTFVIAKKYDIFFNDFTHLVHLDAYRLKNSSELGPLNWQETIADPKNLVMIEWPELVIDGMPANIQYIDFKHVDDTTREITVNTK